LVATELLTSDLPKVFLLSQNWKVKIGNGSSNAWPEPLVMVEVPGSTVLIKVAKRPKGFELSPVRFVYRPVSVLAPFWMICAGVKPS
jgi:hypothetical protein